MRYTHSSFLSLSHETTERVRTKVRVYKWVYTGRKVSKGGMGRDMAGWVSKKRNLLRDFKQVHIPMLCTKKIVITVILNFDCTAHSLRVLLLYCNLAK